MKFETFKQQQLQDPAVKAEYDLLTPQYELIRQIIKLRQEQHLTQKALAEKTGIAQSAISRFESGNHNPSLEFLRRLALGLGKSVYVELR
ncbi:helix-turn-helix domain-containing protein [Exercitatus varius]|uniref:helix-turn-helix domain-containing protein n=1 Tax=Exercitatus varius TaxID=67857 RepID=UPI0018A65DB1|nr:helix-turn-helix transcriptional regulator [Exercitatus varius]MDG2941165.1 helix-turn-helix transcriptional regulator [Exercitatus varius]QOF68340.1 helix-turn-helix transcriptional regulator [Actinobacillus sp. GY-402]